MELSTVFISVAVIWMVAAVTPGPNFFITVRTAMTQSRKSAVFVALGIGSGTVIWGISGFLGIAMLFKTAPWIYSTLKILGGIYLVYLGLKLILQSVRPANGNEIKLSRHIGPIHAFKTGLLTNLSNPKTAAFVTSLFAATVPADAPMWMGLTAVGLMCLISLIWYATAAFIFSTDRFRSFYNKGLNWIERLSGAIFIGFGVKLAAGE